MRQGFLIPERQTLCRMYHPESDQAGKNNRMKINYQDWKLETHFNNNNNNFHE